jgi:hypothetical protein
MSRIRDIANLFSANTAASTDAEVTAAIAAHSNATTAIHGITDTSALATSASVSSAISTHSSATDPHGDRSFATSAVSTHNTAANGHFGRGTTASRPASPTVGDLYFDTTLSRLLIYTSSGWTSSLIAEAPGLPTGLSGVSYNQKISLSWVAPSYSGGYSISDYVIQYSSDSGSSWTTVSHAASTATSIDVTGLTNGTSYIFRVSAINAIGTGQYSLNSTSYIPSPPTITGGTLTSDATYYYRTFTSTGTLSISGGAVPISYLLVAGGGGSGGGGNTGYYSGGGGGGGVLSSTTPFSTTTTVIIGAGGAAGSQTGDTGIAGTNGDNTTAFGLTAVGGGGGGGNSTLVDSITGKGKSGGSGGGGALYSTASGGGAGTSGQGYSGGGTTGTSSGGGGGAGGAGGAGNSNTGGAAGAALSSSINGTATLYAGGGAGRGSSSNGSTSSGGTAAETAGASNTGNGAGGILARAGFPGGSGIVIVKYLKSDVGA